MGAMRKIQLMGMIIADNNPEFDITDITLEWNKISGHRMQSFVLTDTSVQADRHKCFARKTQVFEP